MIYLDNAATSFPKPEAVYSAMDRFARTSLGNPGRAGHRLALAAEEAIDRARAAVQRLVGGISPHRVAFTLNATDALNLAIKGAVRAGDHVVTSDLEHNSVLRPIAALERAGKIRVTRVASSPDGFVDPDDVRRALDARTRLVVLTHASNVLGTVQPIAEVGRFVREVGALFLVDASQTAGVVPIDVRTMHVDLVAAPGHKSLLGPPGTGFLYVGERAQLLPWREGGTGGDGASPLQPRDLPYALEAGTPNVPGLVGLTAGIADVTARDVGAIRRHETSLVAKVWRWAERSGRYRPLGAFDAATHVGTISLVPDTHAITPVDVAAILDQMDIAVRAGIHCAPEVHRAQGTLPSGAVRVSPGPFTTDAEITTLCDALDEIAHEAAA